MWVMLQHMFSRAVLLLRISKMHILILWLWCGAWDYSFLTTYKEMLVPMSLIPTLDKETLKDIIIYQMLALIHRLWMLQLWNPLLQMHWTGYHCCGWYHFWNGKQSLVKFPAKWNSRFFSFFTILHAEYINTVKQKQKQKNYSLHFCELKISRFGGLAFCFLSARAFLYMSRLYIVTLLI